MKKITAFVLCAVLLFTLCGCAKKDEEGVKATVTGFMDAVIAGNIDAIKEYAGSADAALGVFPNSADITDSTHSSQVRLSRACRDKMTYEIGKITFKDSDYANVEVIITLPNLSELGKKQIANIAANRLRIAYEEMIEEINNGAATKTVTRNCELAYDGEKWKIDYSFESSVYSLMSVSGVFF